MDRVALLVDAEYVTNAALPQSNAPGTSVAYASSAYVSRAAHDAQPGSEPARDHGRIIFRSDELMPALSDEATARTEHALLRLYWYSPWPRSQGSINENDLFALQLQPDTKVRVGTPSQGPQDTSSVATLLQRDLLQLAQLRSVSDLVIISADESLAAPIEEAQAYGIRVHLWGIQDVNGLDHQSHQLIAACDTRVVISHAWITHFTRSDKPAQQVEAPAEQAVLESPAAAELPAGPSAGPDAASTPSTVGMPDAVPEVRTGSRRARREALRAANPEPTDGAMADGTAPEPLGTDPSSSDSAAALGLNDTGPVAVSYSEPPVHAHASSAPVDDPTHLFPATTSSRVLDLGVAYQVTIPRLSEVTSHRQHGGDVQQDQQSGPMTALEVGATYGRRWFARTTSDQQNALTARYQPPMVPTELRDEIGDYALSLGAEPSVVAVVSDELVAGFWDAVTAGNR